VKTVSSKRSTQLQSSRSSTPSSSSTPALPLHSRRNPSHPEACAAYKKRVKPYWIGQRIAAETDNARTETTETLTGRIKDYFVATRRVQIWYDNEDSTFENIELDKLLCWTVPDTLLISEYLTYNSRWKYQTNDFIPTDCEFKPMQVAMLQRVSVRFRRHAWYTALVDGYDSVSRRHHVNYGETSEWMWLHPTRVRLIKKRLTPDLEALRTRISRSQRFAVAPPWDPEPYGLDKKWAEFSKQLENLKLKSGECVCDADDVCDDGDVEDEDEDEDIENEHGAVVDDDVDDDDDDDSEYTGEEQVRSTLSRPRSIKKKKRSFVAVSGKKVKNKNGAKKKRKVSKKNKK